MSRPISRPILPTFLRSLTPSTIVNTWYGEKLRKRPRWEILTPEFGDSYQSYSSDKEVRCGDYRCLGFPLLRLYGEWQIFTKIGYIRTIHRYTTTYAYLTDREDDGQTIYMTGESTGKYPERTVYMPWREKASYRIRVEIAKIAHFIWNLLVCTSLLRISLPLPSWAQDNNRSPVSHPFGSKPFSV